MTHFSNVFTTSFIWDDYGRNGGKTAVSQVLNGDDYLKRTSVAHENNMSPTMSLRTWRKAFNFDTPSTKNPPYSSR